MSLLHVAALLATASHLSAIALATEEARDTPRAALDNIGGAQGQVKCFASSEKSMHATNLSMPTPHVPIARIRNTRDLFALVPREIRHLLLVVDPTEEPEAALTIALEIAERCGPQITLVHGGRLSGWGVTRDQCPETALMDLLCLSWQVKWVYPDISISQTLPASLAEVLEEAVGRKVDLIMFPEPLAARFRNPDFMISDGIHFASACPIIVVTKLDSDWFESNQ